MPTAFTDNTSLRLTTAKTGGQKCSVCGLRIPKDVPRLTFAKSFESTWRVCGVCLLRLGGRMAQVKAVQDWAVVVTAEEL